MTLNELKVGQRIRYKTKEFGFEGVAVLSEAVSGGFICNRIHKDGTIDPHKWKLDSDKIKQWEWFELV